MPKSILTKELTRYGDRYHTLSDILFYSSERTVEQYKKMRMYPMCWMGLNFLKLGLADIPPTYEFEDEDIRIITEKVFGKIWRKLIKEATESVDFGFKAMEVRWEPGVIKYKDKNETEKTYEGVLLKQPKGLDGETIEILITPDTGRFRGFIQDSEEARKCLAEDKKALVFTHNLESGNFYGISAQEPIYPFWYDANINRQFHMRWLERKGTGLFEGRYPIGKSNENGVDIDNQDIMLDLLDGVMEGTHIALPSGRDANGNYQWDIKILEGADHTDPFLSRAQYLDETILRGFVIPEKALTQGEVGARSSIEAFQGLFIMRKQDLYDHIVDTIDKYLVQPFIKLNWGDSVEGHVRSGKLDDDSKYTANKIVEKLVEQGKEFPEQQWLIDKTGIPLEERKELEEMEVVDDRLQTEKETQTEEQGEGEGIEEVKKAKEKSEEEKFAARELVLSKREKQFNLSELDSFLNEESEKFQISLTEELLAQADRIKKYLDKNYITDKFINVANGIVISKGKIKKIMKNYLNNIYNFSFDNFKQGVEKKKNFAVTETPNQFINFRADLLSIKLSNDLETAIRYQIARDISSQLSKPELLNSVTQVFRNFISAKLTTLAGTEMGFTLNKSNADYLLLNKKLIKQGVLKPEKEIQRFQFSAILDRRTSEICTALYTQYGEGGLIVEEGSPILSEYATPIHYNCRSVWLPITKEEIDSPAFEQTDLTMKNNRPITVQAVTAKLGNKIQGKTFSEIGG
jgi:hypothetical protein